MRICLVIYGLLDSRSGGYLYDSMLVKTLRQRGHNVEIVSLANSTYLGCLLQNLDWNLSASLSSWKGDLIIEDELVHPSLIAANRRLRRSAPRHPPVVALVHHLRASERHSRLLAPLYRLVELAFLRSTDAFIFNSLTSRSSVERLLGTELPFVVAHPGGDRLDAVSRANPEEGAGPVRLLFVGNRIPRKNLLILLQALALVAGDWRLDVVGAGPSIGARGRDARYDRACRVAAAALGGRVSFLGRVDDEALAAAYGRSDVFVLPSDHEGFGIAYVEAMRAGLVPVGADSGGAREAIGDAGMLVPPRDRVALAAAITRLIADGDERRCLAAAARARLSPGWEESMSKIADWLESGLGRAQR